MFKSLTTKIMVTMILMSTIGLVLLAALSFYELKGSVEKQMENDGKTLVTTIRREISKYKISNLKEIQDLFLNVKKESEGNIEYISLSDNNSKLLVSDTRSIESTSVKSGSKVDTVSSASESESVNAVVEGNKIIGSTLLVSSGNKVYNVSAPLFTDSKMTGVLNVGISLNNMNSQIAKTLAAILIIGLIIELITALLALFMAKTLTKPITNIVNKLEHFAKGDFTISFHSKSKDEIHKLSSSLNSSVLMLKNTIGAVKEAAGKLHEIASGLTESGEEASTSSEEVSQNLEAVVNDIIDENLNITNILKSLEDFGIKLDFVLTQTGSALNSNDKIRTAATQGHTELDGLNKSFDDVKASFDTAAKDIVALNVDVSKISGIAEVINGVAEQTNLLALNAAIESARAGDAGKGFAVVADEIRKLAEQVMKSSKMINQLINNVIQTAKSVVTDTETISGKMDMQKMIIGNSAASMDNIKLEVETIIIEMNNASSSMKDLLVDKEEILKNIGEISQISIQVSGSANEISASIQNQSANVQQLSLLSQEVNEMADRLKHDVNVFKL